MKIVELKNGSKVAIRRVNPDDAAQLTDIQLSIAKENLYMVTESTEFNLTVLDEAQRVDRILDTPGNTLLVAEVNKNIIGFAGIENETKKRKAHIGVLDIFIKENWRETGVGKALMHAILLWAKNNPLIEKIGLAVFANNERAINLYEKLGFAEEGRRVRELKINDNEYIDEVLMYKCV